MVVQTVTFGSGQYSSWTAYGAGADEVSNWTISANVTTAEAPLTGAIGTYVLGSRPVNLYSLTQYWWADANPTTSTIDFQIATAATGSGGWQSGATNANGASTGVTSNYLTNTANTVYYGWYKNDSGNIRFYTYASTGNNIYFNGAVDWADRRQHAAIVVHSVPSAPGAPVGTTINTTAVSLSWTAPSDVGSSGGINGYRILKRLATATANANTDWSVAISDTGSTALSATVTGLLPGTAYKFMVAGLNSVTDLIVTNYAVAYTSLNAHTGTNSTLSANVSTLGGVYNGTTWVASPNIMTYNGTAWVDANIRSYDGATWNQFGA